MKNFKILACAGAEYNGELARQVAIELSENSPIEDNASLFCFTIFLRNILLKEENLAATMKSQLESSFTIVIDGCSGSCIFKILKYLEIKPDLVVNIQKLVPKEPINFNDIEAFKNRPRVNAIKKEDIEKVKQYIIEKLNEKNILT